MNRVGKWIADILYPRRCPLCDCVLPVGEKDFCADCRRCLRLIPVRAVRCCRCGKPLIREQSPGPKPEVGRAARLREITGEAGEFCKDCTGKNVSFRSGSAVFVYDRYMQEAVGRWKYSGRREYTEIFARYLYEEYGKWIQSCQPQGLLPVPVHPGRYRERGYNQAELLAEALSRLTAIPVCRYLLRTADTRPQKNLSPQERRQNLQEAFVLNRREAELKPVPECVIIIDDIYTTGSTIEACSLVLREAGVMRIYFLCLCIGQGY